MEEHKARHYAILIGINSQDSETGTSLRGCVPDVVEITKSLKQSFIEDLSLYSFTASLKPNSLQPTEPKEQWPTYDNIRSHLCKVIQNARQGDHVYIHFSGHSTKVPPEEPHSNWDTGDLALVVRDGPDASEERYFYGRELAEHLRDMVDKGLGVTIVLDCCYSGSTPRNDEVVRYVPYRPEVDEKYPPRTKAAQLTMKSDGSSLRGKRLATLTPNWLANPEGYTILTSSDATEQAYGIKFDKSKDGLRHGTLTYFLLETFDALGGVGGGMHQLHQYVSVRIADHRRYHKTKTQSPVLFGNKVQLFFGLPKPGCSGDIPVTKITDGTPAFRLHAGAAHGISEGDQFTLRQFRYDIPPADCAPVTAEAISVRGVTSDLRITEANNNAVETGWLATAITRLSLRKFPVRLSVGQAYQAEWREALQKRISLAEHDEDDTDSMSGWSITVAHVHDMQYEIRDDRDQLITRLDGADSLERARQRLLCQVQHLVSFRLVRDLANHAEGMEMQRFKRSFSAILFKENEGTIFNPGCTRTRDLHKVCAHPECRLTLTPADRVNLIVKNKADRDGPRLFVYVYAMGSGWEVEDMTKSSRVVIPPPGSGGDGPKATGVFQRTLHFPLKEGQRSCEEALKVFLTRQPTSFITLELPKLGKNAPSRVGAEMSGNRGPLWESEDWAALTFRVRVVSEGADMS